MDERLRALIQSYRMAVAAAVRKLSESGIALPRSNREWAMNGMPNLGQLVSGGSYRKHGYGCEVSTSKGSVDFDFGDAGETDGFDSWRLMLFAEAHPDLYDPAGRDSLQAQL